MGRYKYPPMRQAGFLPDGSTPPEHMTEEERIKFATKISITAAERIGGVPSKEKDKKQSP